MFTRPPVSERSRDRDRERHAWLEEARESDVVIVGGGLSALVAGILLGQEDRQSLIVEEAEQLGGRLLWENGPATVLSPADEILDELGFSLPSESPSWPDRIQLISFLAHEFFEEGGRVLPGVSVQAPPVETGESFQLELYFWERHEVFTSPEIIVTLPLTQPARPPRPGDNPLEEMVLATGRRQDNWIQAGFQALNPETRDEPEPFENACILSGRKAAEVILNPDE